MKKVFKYEIGSGKNIVKMPRGARILSAAAQFHHAYVWALVDEHAPVIRRPIYAAMTGEAVPYGYETFIGTVFLDTGAFVLHVFDSGEV